MCSFDNYSEIDPKTVEHIAGDFFLKVGIMPSLYGFPLAVKCAELCFRCNGKYSLTKDIYKKAGESFSASAGSVERNIRSALEKSCICGNILGLDGLMGSAVVPKSGFITTGQLLAFAKEYLTRKLVYTDSMPRRSA